MINNDNLSGNKIFHYSIQNIVSGNQNKIAFFFTNHGKWQQNHDLQEINNVISKIFLVKCLNWLIIN